MRFTQKAVVVLIVLMTDCAYLEDPAVRTAYCLERTINADDRSPELEATCDLGVNAGYVLVLRPAGSLSKAQQAEAGITDELAGEIHALELEEYSSIYVRPADGSSFRPSFTTTQSRFVRIPRPIVVRKQLAGPVTITLRRSATRIDVVAAK